MGGREGGREAAKERWRDKRGYHGRGRREGTSGRMRRGGGQGNWVQGTAVDDEKETQQVKRDKRVPHWKGERHEPDQRTTNNEISCWRLLCINLSLEASIQRQLNEDNPQGDYRCGN